MDSWVTVTLTLVALLLAAVLHFYSVVRYVRYFKKYGIDYSQPWPIVGNMGSIICRKLSMWEIISWMYNLNHNARYIGFLDMMTPVVVIRDVDIIKQIAVKNFEDFPHHRTFVDEEQDPLFAKNLFSLRGEKWKSTRITLSPTFTSSKLKGMCRLMYPCGLNMARYVRHLSPEKRDVELKDIATRYASDVTATCAFGISVDSMTNQNNDFFVNGKKVAFNNIGILKFFLIRSFPGLSRMLNMRLVEDSASRFFKDVVFSAIKARDNGTVDRPDMIQLMVGTKTKHSGNGLSLDDIVAQAFIFFIAGFDTVSTGICFACHELAVHSDVQSKLQDEIDRLLEKTDGCPTYEDINNMEYLDAVVNESLRMYPIVPFIDRVCSRRVELPPSSPEHEPLIVEKGSVIWFPSYGLHFDPKYYDAPTKFDPERFVKYGKEIQSSGAYQPFGTGPRMCIGNRFALLEMKLFIFSLLSACNVKPNAKTQIPMKLSRNSLQMQPANGGFWMRVEPRENAHSSVCRDCFAELRNDNSNVTVKSFLSSQ